VDFAIKLCSLSKTYDSRWTRFQIRALNDISLQIPPETTTILLGPNGSGKSTILKILATLTNPSSGQAIVFDYDVMKTPLSVRRVTGFLPENLSPPPDVTAYEYLNLIGHLRNINSGLSSRIKELLQKVRLVRWSNMPIRTFSRGMQQRLGFAQTMIGDPDLYLLDEPLSSLDTSGRNMLLESLQELKENGKTIVISTHRDDFFRDLADQRIILENGSISEATRGIGGNIK
jgi:ABC-2 type transport system ATP-binding protein